MKKYCLTSRCAMAGAIRTAASAISLRSIHAGLFIAARKIYSVIIFGACFDLDVSSSNAAWLVGNFVFRCHCEGKMQSIFTVFARQRKDNSVHIFNQTIVITSSGVIPDFSNSFSKFCQN